MQGNYKLNISAQNLTDPEKNEEIQQWKNKTQQSVTDSAEDYQTLSADTEKIVDESKQPNSPDTIKAYVEDNSNHVQSPLIPDNNSVDASSVHLDSLQSSNNEMNNNINSLPIDSIGCEDPTASPRIHSSFGRILKKKQYFSPQRQDRFLLRMESFQNNVQLHTTHHKE